MPTREFLWHHLEVARRAPSEPSPRIRKKHALYNAGHYTWGGEQLPCDTPPRHAPALLPRHAPNKPTEQSTERAQLTSPTANLAQNADQHNPSPDVGSQKTGSEHTRPCRRNRASHRHGKNISKHRTARSPGAPPKGMHGPTKGQCRQQNRPKENQKPGQNSSAIAARIPDRARAGKGGGGWGGSQVGNAQKRRKRDDDHTNKSNNSEVRFRPTDLWTMSSTR